MEYDISIIIPVYNAENTLRWMFHSLKRQTLGFSRLEIVFADDCSTDGSADLLRGFSSAYGNVKVVTLSKNSGYAGAPRNAALKVASAPYVMFLDADDRYTPRACELLLKALIENDADIASGYYAEHHDSDRALDRAISDAYAEMPIGVCELSTSINAWRPLADALWCKIYKREIIDVNELGFDEDFPGEDALFLIEYLCCCRRAVYIKEKTTEYFVSDSSVSHSSSRKFFEKTAVFFERLQAALHLREQSGFFFEFVNGFAALDYYLGRFIAECGELPDGEAVVILRAWRTMCEYALESGVTLHSPLVRIVVRHNAAGDEDRALLAFREAASAARLRTGETQAIFCSRSWRTATKLRKLTGKR
ncbi:MAG: glycosyltransferase family 2 protein [Oscillospiraceae bacterium]